MIKNKISVIKDDITTQKVDVIVNAANIHLSDGAGINGAIHAAAGKELAEACEKLGDCATGSAKITPGFLLPAKYIIHAVGPIWRGGNKGEAKLLASCYLASFKLALAHQVKTIAFPAVSCGIYGYPVSQAALIAVTETANFLDLHPEFQSVIFVCFDDNVFEAYQNAVDLLPHE